MTTIRGAAYGLDGPRSQTPQPYGPLPPARPAARDRRSAAGRLQAMLYRYPWLRWAAAGGAALIVVASLSGDGSDPVPEPVPIPPPGPAGLLAPHTRGVPVPVDSAVFAVGDTVDVHAVLDGAAVVAGALVVDSDREAGEVVVAVPAEQVDATVDALTTGGVILVLAPETPAAPPG